MYMYLQDHVLHPVSPIKCMFVMNISVSTEIYLNSFIPLFLCGISELLVLLFHQPLHASVRGITQIILVNPEVGFSGEVALPAGIERMNHIIVITLGVA